MTTTVKLGGFVAVLAVVVAASFGVGNAVGPFGAGAGAGHEGAGHAGHAQPGGVGELPGGLMVAEHGYALELSQAVLSPGRSRVAFQVSGPDGEPVTDFESTHDKDLHFIAVRRDMAGFQHLHPTMDAAGTWSVDADLTPGVWRFYADFKPAGHGETMTLGADASVAGVYQPRDLPPVSQSAQVDDYTVALNGQLRPGESSRLALSVSRNGVPVTDLQPYLGAYGHLVALRSGDLAYLHVHPDGAPGDGRTAAGPEITFFATAPTAGPYRLYLDFQHEGVVRTAEFTAEAGGPAAGGPAPVPAQPGGGSSSQAPGSDGHGGHGHN